MLKENCFLNLKILFRRDRLGVLGWIFAFQKVAHEKEFIFGKFMYTRAFTEIYFRICPSLHILYCLSSCLIIFFHQHFAMRNLLIFI